MSRKRRTPSDTPQGELLSATDAAKLLGIGRTYFWQLRKERPLARVEGSKETRPFFRREDVLAWIEPQGVGGAPAQASPTGDTEERLAFARAKWITSFAHLPDLPDFPSDEVLLAHYTEGYRPSKKPAGIGGWKPDDEDVTRWYEKQGLPVPE